MGIHNIYAQIQKQEVKNVMVCANYEKANQITRLTYGEDAFAVDCQYYGVNPGDYYKDSTFYYNDGVTPVPRSVTGDARCEKISSDIVYLSVMTGIEL